LLEGGAGLSGAVGGEADKLAKTNEAAGFSDGLVVLTNMNSIRAGETNEFGVVVENEGHIGLAAERGEVLGKREDFGGREIFRAELEDLDTACEHGACDFDGLGGLAVAEVENAVEEAIGEVGGHCRAAAAFF
jgi:hypothetical protein